MVNLQDTSLRGPRLCLYKSLAPLLPHGCLLAISNHKTPTTSTIKGYWPFIVTSQAFFGTTQTPRYFFENIPGRYPAPEATEIVDSLASPVQHRDERQHVEFAEVERNSLAGPTRR